MNDDVLTVERLDEVTLILTLNRPQRRQRADDRDDGFALSGP